jgi:aminoglycoside phosphotransferase (APT) family kinase protein
MLTVEETAAVLAQACKAAGLSGDGARLLRLGSNAVYRLKAPVVARITRAGTGSEPARRAVAVARWLESDGYPAVRALQLDQPVDAGGHVVTFWEAVSDNGDEYATTAEVAGLIARLHQMTAPEALNLPALDPFGDAGRRIAESRWLNADDRAWMAGELERLRAGYASLEFALPQGVIHGDASIGNVLRGYRGGAVLIDLDGFAAGPREWDLIQTAIYHDRFGWHTREEYEDFCQVYGYDLTRWPGYPVLAAVREFVIVTWMAGKAPESSTAAAEAAKRLSALRSGGSRKDWRPF